MHFNVKNLNKEACYTWFFQLFFKGKIYFTLQKCPHICVLAPKCLKNDERPYNVSDIDEKQHPSIKSIYLDENQITCMTRDIFQPKLSKIPSGVKCKYKWLWVKHKHKHLSKKKKIKKKNTKPKT